MHALHLEASTAPLDGVMGLAHASSKFGSARSLEALEEMTKHELDELEDEAQAALLGEKFAAPPSTARRDLL